MAKLILVNSTMENSEAYKSIDILADFSVVKKDANKIEIRSHSNDELITIEMSIEEFQKLLGSMKSL